MPKDSCSDIPNLLPRWYHCSFSFCGLILDVTWTLPYFFPFVPSSHISSPNSTVPMSLISAHCLVSPIYPLWPSSLMHQWSRAAHSGFPRLAHSSNCPLICTLSLASDFPGLASHYTLSVSGIQFRGKKKTHEGWRNPSSKERKASKKYFANISFTKLSSVC